MGLDVSNSPAGQAAGASSVIWGESATPGEASHDTRARPAGSRHSSMDLAEDPRAHTWVGHTSNRSARVDASSQALGAQTSSEVTLNSTNSLWKRSRGWWARLASNQRPADYESAALTRLSYGPLFRHRRMALTRPLAAGAERRQGTATATRSLAHPACAGISLASPAGERGAGQTPAQAQRLEAAPTTQPASANDPTEHHLARLSGRGLTVTLRS